MGRSRPARRGYLGLPGRPRRVGRHAHPQPHLTADAPGWSIVPSPSQVLSPRRRPVQPSCGAVFGGWRAGGGWCGDGGCRRIGCWRCDGCRRCCLPLEPSRAPEPVRSIRWPWSPGRWRWPSASGHRADAAVSCCRLGWVRRRVGLPAGAGRALRWRVQGRCGWATRGALQRKLNGNSEINSLPIRSGCYRKLRALVMAPRRPAQDRGQSTADGARVGYRRRGHVATFSASTSRARDAPSPGSQAAAGQG